MLISLECVDKLTLKEMFTVECIKGDQTHFSEIESIFFQSVFFNLDPDVSEETVNEVNKSRCAVIKTFHGDL